MTTLNLPLIERVLHQITLDPEHWDQTYWAAETTCGTTMCFAGWAIALSHPGAEFTSWDEVESKPGVFRDAGNVRLPGQDPAEDDIYIPMLAEQLLGMTAAESGSIFYSTDVTLQELRRKVEDIVNAHGLTLTAQADLDLAGGPQ